MHESYYRTIIPQGNFISIDSSKNELLYNRYDGRKNSTVIHFSWEGSHEIIPYSNFAQAQIVFALVLLFLHSFYFNPRF